MNSSNEIEFSLWQELQRTLRYSWFVALLMVLGAAGGELFHQVQKPVYEAKAEITVQIDYSRAGYLTDVQQDQVMETVGDLVALPQAKQAAALLANWPSAEIENGAYLEHFFLERQNFRWVMRVRDSDAALTSAAVNAWADQSASLISEGLEHAIIAEGLDRYQASLEKCLEQVALVEPVQAFCAAQNLAEIQSELQSAAKVLRDERVKSQGLFPGISFVLSDQAVTPSKPVQHGRNSSILAGTLLGIILGVIGLSIGVPERWMKRSR